MEWKPKRVGINIVMALFLGRETCQHNCCHKSRRSSRRCWWPRGALTKKDDDYYEKLSSKAAASRLKAIQQYNTHSMALQVVCFYLSSNCSTTQQCLLFITHLSMTKSVNPLSNSKGWMGTEGPKSAIDKNGQNHRFQKTKQTFG